MSLQPDEQSGSNPSRVEFGKAEEWFEDRHSLKFRVVEYHEPREGTVWQTVREAGGKPTYSRSVWYSHDEILGIYRSGQFRFRPWQLEVAGYGTFEAYDAFDGVDIEPDDLPPTDQDAENSVWQIWFTKKETRLATKHSKEVLKSGNQDLIGTFVTNTVSKFWVCETSNETELIDMKGSASARLRVHSARKTSVTVKVAPLYCGNNREIVWEAPMEFGQNEEWFPRRHSLRYRLSGPQGKYSIWYTYDEMVGIFHSGQMYTAGRCLEIDGLTPSEVGSPDAGISLRFTECDPTFYTQLIYEFEKPQRRGESPKPKHCLIWQCWVEAEYQGKPVAYFWAGEAEGETDAGHLADRVESRYPDNCGVFGCSYADGVTVRLFATKCRYRGLHREIEWVSTITKAASVLSKLFSRL
jgi:hypothetical protein